ncbi:MAG: hypothetical protein QOH50_820, partial [Kribbellaceae bacterium]|nr:hypothetical protein [Kribbellaceae bacterium]
MLFHRGFFSNAAWCPPGRRQ